MWITISWSSFFFMIGRYLGKWEQRNIDEQLIPTLKNLPKTLD